MQVHEEAIKRAAKLSPQDVIQLLSNDVEVSSQEEYQKAITSIWKENITVRGENISAYRVFVRLDCSHSLAKIGWLMEEGMPYCVLCGSTFGVFNNRSHCRACGNLICQSCRLLSHLEGMEVHGQVPVCSQCCWGQRIVSIQPSLSGEPLLMRDLGSPAHYTLARVEPCYVLSCSCDVRYASVYVNISSCPLVPPAVPGASPSVAVLCGCQRLVAEEAGGGPPIAVFDIVVHPSALVDREETPCHPSAELDRRCLEQIARFLERCFALPLASARALRCAYFDPALAAFSPSELRALAVAVHVPIPPTHLFERYLQVPLLGEDCVQVRYRPSSLSPARTTTASAATATTATSATTGLERWLGDVSDTSTVLGEGDDRSVCSAPVDSVRSHFKLLSHTRDKSLRAAASSSAVDALTSEEVVDFHNPRHVLAVLSQVAAQPARPPSVLRGLAPGGGGVVPGESSWEGAGLLPGGLRSPVLRLVGSAPRVMPAGVEGRVGLTAAMLAVDRRRCVDSASAERVKKAAKKDRSLLVGWQVMVYAVDGREMRGVYVVTGQRRGRGGGAVYRLSSFEGEEDMWAPLSSRLHSKGFPYLPLRQVL